MALGALSGAVRQHERDKDVLRSLTPRDLAQAWHVHPSSAFRVLERLRKQGAVARTGRGLNAEYAITHAGLKKLDYFQELARFRARYEKKGRRVAANPEDQE